MYVHTFGAYFGVACSLIITDKVKLAAAKRYEQGSYNSNLIAMIGTIFLWCFWPSFNGGLTDGNTQMRVIVNTTLALSGSCISAFAFSSVFNDGKFEMEDVLNATLAGGVVVGSTCDMMQ
jgi:ammonium transporter Rh